MTEPDNASGRHERDGRGRWRKGVSGNPAGASTGSRNRVTKAAEALLDGEAETLTRKAVDLALDGDTTALRLCLERIVPLRKDAPVQFDLPPMKGAEDAARAAGAVVAAVAQGELTPTEGAHVMGLVDAYRRALETSELDARLHKVEERLERRR